MPVPNATEIEVTQDNAADIAEKEYLREKAEREGKEPPKEEPPKKEEKPPEHPAKEDDKQKTDDDLLETKDDELNEDEKKRKDTLIKELAQKNEEKAKEDERILATEDAQLKEEELARKKELLAERGKDAISREKEERSFAEEVKTYAKEHKITEENARMLLTDEKESIKKISEKYSSDPVKLAKAVLGLQRGYTKSQEELRSIQTQVAMPKVSVDTVIQAINAGKFTHEGKPLTAEEVVEAYRKQHPDTTDKIEDNEVVLHLVAKEIKDNWELKQKESVSVMEKEANKKRDKLIDELSEEEKNFLPDIKPLLTNMPAAQIMRDDFNLEDLLNWARGKNYKKDVEAAREDGFRRGRESTKIKTGPVGTGAPGTGKTGPVALTDIQKDEALEMFPSAKDADEAYKLYAELLEDEKKYQESKKARKE